MRRNETEGAPKQLTNDASFYFNYFSAVSRLNVFDGSTTSSCVSSMPNEERRFQIDRGDGGQRENSKYTEPDNTMVEKRSERE